jgi:alanine racemase
MSAIPSPATGRDAPSETALLTIDLTALAHNWRRLRELSAPAECAAVVKADAYGLGLAPVMRALLAEGCKSFFVATVAEGERARAIAREAAIYVFDGLAPGTAPRLKAAALRPALNSMAEIAEWAGSGLPAALHFDTGMNRMGLAVAEAEAAARAIKPCLVMSHFVSSQKRDDPRNDNQIAGLAAARAHFPGVPGSICNSSGIFLPQKPLLELTANPMRVVARLQARILSTREIAPGESVGYDATWTATRPTRLATIGAGYADGLPIGASSGVAKPAAQALVGGARCPIVGRVSMDFIVLDVTDAPQAAAKRGEWAEILGEQISVDELAARAGTIGYEILTRLGARYERRYVGG